ncbi:MAG: hypothetical protein ACI8RZ_000800 [Myxococcota bacterium]|jgi:hypothetical protein
MTHRLTLPALSLLLSCDGCGSQEDSAALVSHPENRVVVLVLDGIRLEESLGNGYSNALGMQTQDILPRINTIIDESGARITAAMASGITITGPGHSDLLTGLHHSFANYPAEDGPFAYLPELPSLLSVLPEGEALLATNSLLVTPLTDSTSPLTIAPAAVLEGTVDGNMLMELRERLTDSTVRLALVNLHQSDSQGHIGLPGGYGEKVLALDGSIASFWAWMQSDPGWKDATLVLVADHGRHRRDEEEGWREHGDHCTGCREIPMALIGSEIVAGAVVSDTHTLQDLGQTIAWLLDEPMLYGTGRVIDAALATPSGEPGATGAVEPAAAGDVLAWEARTGETDPRAVVIRDDETVSDPAAFAAEAPAVAVDGNSAALCWRELHIDDAETWPWKPACQLRDAVGSWQDLGGPTDLVWSRWRPSLALQGDSLLAGWVDNSSGVVVASSSRLVLSRWRSSGGWSEVYATNVGSFPADPALILDGDDALLAMAVSEDGLPGRISRRIDVHRIDTITNTGELALSIRPLGAEKDGDFRLPVDRLEHPALWNGTDSTRLAFISYTLGEDGRPRTDLWQSTDLGEPELIDTDLLGHLAPAYDTDGTLRWIRQRDGVIALCEGQASDCTTLDTEAVRGLATSGGSAWISVLGADRTWSLQTP